MDRWMGWMDGWIETDGWMDAKMPLADYHHHHHHHYNQHHHHHHLFCTLH